MTEADIDNLIETGGWVPLASLVIFFLIRLFKDDTKLPTIPVKLRFWSVFLLGIASAVIQRAAAGAAWKHAIVGGLVSSLLALAYQNGLIDNLRGGKEFVIPGLIKPGVAPAPGKPISLPPKKMEDIPTPVATPAIDQEARKSGEDFEGNTPPK